MKRAYCWRCKNFIVVIDEIDLMEFDQLYAKCLEQVKQYREQNKVATPNEVHRAQPLWY